MPIPSEKQRIFSWQVMLNFPKKFSGLEAFLVWKLLGFLETHAKKLNQLVENTQKHLRRTTFLSLMSVADTMEALMRAECMTLYFPLRRSDYAEFFCYISITHEFLESVLTMIRKRHSIAFSSTVRTRMKQYDAEFLEYFEIRLGVRQPPKIQPTIKEEVFFMSMRVEFSPKPIHFERRCPQELFHLELCVPCPPKPFYSPKKPLPPPKKNPNKGR
jgi:hypothetical protein